MTEVMPALKPSPRAVIPVRIAVVGLGYWGPNLVRNIAELQTAELAAICDTSAARLETTHRRFPAATVETDYDTLLERDDIEAVALATPVSTHFGLGQKALKAGKHVFVEKPMAASLAEARSLMALATETHLTLMPGHTFLYSPAVHLMKETIDRGDLGEIYYIAMSRVNLGLHQSDVSVICDLGAHDFAILRYWLGESPTEVSAVTRNCVLPGTADVAFVDLRYGSGVLAHVELSWLAPGKLRRTVLVGSEKMAVYDDTSPEPVRIFDSGVDLREPRSFGEFRLTYRSGDIVSPHVDVAEPIGLELEDFCRAVRTGSTPRSSAHLGADVIDTIERAERAAGDSGSR